MDKTISASAQVSEVLSVELSSTKTKLDQTLEQNHSLEHAKKLAFQQHNLYEQEIKTLEQQLQAQRKVSAKYLLNNHEATWLYSYLHVNTHEKAPKK